MCKTHICEVCEGEYKCSVPEKYCDKPRIYGICEKCAKERYTPPSPKLYARFSLEGYKKIEANMVEKGNTWKTLAKRFLLFKLDEYIKAEKWTDAANICFFLWAREMDK